MVQSQYRPSDLNRRISQLLSDNILDDITPGIQARLVESNVIDENGSLINPDDYELRYSHFQNTIYDWFDYADSHALHSFYAEAIDATFRRFELVFLERESWTNGFFKQFLKPRTLVFCERGITSNK